MYNNDTIVTNVFINMYDVIEDFDVEIVSVFIIVMITVNSVLWPLWVQKYFVGTRETYTHQPPAHKK